MEKISKATAQKIVETVKEVCGCDVNFIEGKGRIIASTNQKRVGDFHEGGHLAAQRNETLEVFQDGQFPGARKGVNIPVCHQGRPGLSGTLRCLFPGTDQGVQGLRRGAISYWPKYSLPDACAEPGEQGEFWNQRADGAENPEGSGADRHRISHILLSGGVYFNPFGKWMDKKPVCFSESGH